MLEKPLTEIDKKNLPSPEDLKEYYMSFKNFLKFFRKILIKGKRIKEINKHEDNDEKTIW